MTSPQLSQWCSPLTCSLFNYKLRYVKGFTISLVTKVGKTPPDKAASEGNKLGACLKVLTITGSLQQERYKGREIITITIITDLGQELERIILKDVDALMIGTKVVNLLPVNKKRRLARRDENTRRAT